MRALWQLRPRAMLLKLHLVSPNDPAALERMFAAADANGDGKISFDEFVQVFATDAQRPGGK